MHREGGLPALANGPSVRVISVSLEIHSRFWNPYDFDLLEFIGKNVAGLCESISVLHLVAIFPASVIAVPRE